jgi:hypothetical protein
MVPRTTLFSTPKYILFLPTRTFRELQNFVMACQGVVTLTNEPLLTMKTIGDSYRVHSCMESIPITSQRKLQPCPVSHSESHSSTNCSPIFHGFLLHNSPSSQPLLTFVVSLVQSSTHDVKLFNSLQDERCVDKLNACCTMFMHSVHQWCSNGCRWVQAKSL